MDFKDWSPEETLALLQFDKNRSLGARACTWNGSALSACTVAAQSPPCATV